MYSRALEGLKFQALPWHFWASQAPQCLVVSSLLSSFLPLPREKGSHSASSPVTWTSCTPPGPQHNRLHFPSLPAREITQASPIPPWELGSPHPLATTKPVSHRPCWFTLLSSAALCDPARQAIFPPPPQAECVTKCWCHLSGVRCFVFGHLRSFRAWDPSFPRRVRGCGRMMRIACRYKLLCCSYPSPLSFKARSNQELVS